MLDLFFFCELFCAHRARCVINPDLPPPRMPPKGKRPAVNKAYLTRVSKRRRGAAETAENTQHPATLRQVPANTGQEIASTSSAGGTANQQPASVPEGTLQGIADAIAKAVKKSLRDTGLVLPHPVNQPQIQFVPDPPPEPASQPSVQAAVRTNIQTLTGGILQVTEPTVDSSKNSFISSAVPLASRIPERIRNKIWANEFIDFSHLLITSKDDNNYTFQLQSNENGQQVLSMVPNYKRPTIQTIEQRTTAFQIFVSIFTQRFPQDSPALMKYGSVVRDLAAQSANWRFYDENFRHLRQEQQISWDNIHSEFWLRTHYQPQKLNGSNRGGQGRYRSTWPRSNFAKGFCWKFHNGTHCNGCAFKHHCFKCGNNHPIFRCQQQQKPTAGRNPTTKQPPMPTNCASHTG